MPLPGQRRGPQTCSNCLAFVMHRLGEPSCEPPFPHFLEAQYSLPFVELCSQTNFTLPQGQQPTNLLNGLIVKFTQMCRPLGTSVNQVLPLYRPSAVRSTMRTRPPSWTRKSCSRNSHNHKWYTDSPIHLLLRIPRIQVGSDCKQ